MAPRCRLVCKLALPFLLVLLARVLASPASRNDLLFLTVFGLPLRIGGIQLLFTWLSLLRSIQVPRSWPEDADGWWCRAAANFREHYKAFQIRTLERRSAFEAACRQALPTLPPRAREVLEREVRAGGLASLLPAPGLTPPFGRGRDHWGTCGAAWSRKTEAELEGGALNVHKVLGIAPLRERVIAMSEVAEALRRSEVVRFDGRGLIPASMFNTSVQRLHELHPGGANFHGRTDFRHGFEDLLCMTFLGWLTEHLAEARDGSLLEWLVERGVTEGLLAGWCHQPWTLEALARSFKRFRPGNFHMGMSRHDQHRAFTDYEQLANRGSGILGSNINAGHLPNWTRGAAEAQDLAAKLGLEGQVAYAHNLLWLGVARGGLHLDTQDNVLVQISGESEVFLVPANCSQLIPDGAPPNIDLIREQGEGFPFFVVKLRPGDALVIPSNTAHAVASPDPGRIGMNFFFEPKHGQMQWPWSPANFYTYATEGHLAMRALFIETIKVMWQAREPGVPSFIVHGQRQEFV